jgi:segregation and condensation protein A
VYEVRLSDFEGPLDLLLFFIQRDELDVYDIPIARITDEYLSYVRLLEEIDLDGAGEFIYMAALLISIKARMLLPRPTSDGDEEIVDPRKELVDRLLEYVRFKDAADRLGIVLDTRSQLYTRDEPDDDHIEPIDASEVTYDVSVFHLVATLRRVLERAAEESSHLVRVTDYSVEEQRDWLRDNITSEEPVSFSEIVAERSKRFVIATFLAILEVVREGSFRLLLGPSSEDFYLARQPGAEVTEQEALN